MAPWTSTTSASQRLGALILSNEWWVGEASEGEILFLINPLSPSSPLSGSDQSNLTVVPLIAAWKPQHDAWTPSILKAGHRVTKFQQNVDPQRRYHHSSVILSTPLRSSNWQERHLSSGANGGSVLPFNERTYRAIWQPMDGSKALDWWSEKNQQNWKCKRSDILTCSHHYSSILILIV